MPLKGKVILLISENHRKCLFMTCKSVAELKGDFGEIYSDNDQSFYHNASDYDYSSSLARLGQTLDWRNNVNLSVLKNIGNIPFLLKFNLGKAATFIVVFMVLHFFMQP